MTRLLPALAVVLLASCASGPKVSYVKLDAASPTYKADVFSAASGGGQVFILPVSKILVARAKTPAAAAPAEDGKPADKPGRRSSTADAPPAPSPPASLEGEDKKAATVVAVEGGNAFVLTPHKGFWSTTETKISFIENTQIPTAVNATFTDRTVDRIKQIGGILKTAVSATGDSASCLAAPLKDFVITASAEAPEGTALPGENGRCWTYKLAFAPSLQAGSIAVSDFVDETTDKRVRYFPVSACRDATLVVTRKIANPSEDDSTTFLIRIADPSRVGLAPLPIKGKITVHQVCGADVADEGAIDNLATFQATLAEIVTQVKAIEAAQGEEKK